jgi:hypothetical protein
LIEIVVGAVVGNAPWMSQGVEQTTFTAFLAAIGSVLLMFLAGAEIDPVSLRRHWKASVSIGVVSFLILSTFIPTLIAQQLFRPIVYDEEEEEALGAEDMAVIHRRRGPPPVAPISTDEGPSDQGRASNQQ